MDRPKPRGDFIDRHADQRRRVRRLEIEVDLGDIVYAERSLHPDPIAEHLSVPTSVPLDGTWAPGQVAGYLADAEQNDAEVPYDDIARARYHVAAMRSPTQGNGRLPILGPDGTPSNCWKPVFDGIGNLIGYDRVPGAGLFSRYYRVGDWLHPVLLEGQPGSTSLRYAWLTSTFSTGTHVWLGFTGDFVHAPSHGTSQAGSGMVPFDLDRFALTQPEAGYSLIGIGHGRTEVQIGGSPPTELAPLTTTDAELSNLQPWPTDVEWRQWHLQADGDTYTWPFDTVTLIRGDPPEPVTWQESAGAVVAYKLVQALKFDGPPRRNDGEVTAGQLLPFSAFGFGDPVGPPFAQATYADVAAAYPAELSGRLADWYREKLDACPFAYEFTGAVTPHPVYGNLAPIAFRSEPYDHVWQKVAVVFDAGWNGSIEALVRHGWIQLRGWVRVAESSNSIREQLAFTFPPDFPQPDFGADDERGITTTDKNGRIVPAVIRIESAALVLRIREDEDRLPTTGTHNWWYDLDGVAYPAAPA